MDFATTLRGLQTANAVLDSLPGLIKSVEQLRQAWTTDQQNEIDALLEKIKRRNDVGFLETDAKLAAASER